ncbi:MAG: AbrB/MazE/SpoVT family DNA-binding domain-containing protein [Hyphomicrobiales bacterium]|nr:AbrB/MazE/SpoVT family DNA-binding domain-containing protein [Hyphomicrobiales bacterium]MBV8442314.1 AbrB/MazE/SpoVT family DNA-binding domain-containing protein [Hyphomicrobiales bacterium]
MKSTLKITSKGQVTLRKAVLDQLGVRPGDRITVEFVAPARMEVRPAEANSSLEAFVGCLKKAGGPTLSIEEIKAIAREGWAGRR